MNKYFYFKNLNSNGAKEFIKSESENFEEYKKSRNNIYQSILSDKYKISNNFKNIKNNFYSSGNVNIWTTPITYIIKNKKYKYLYIQYKNRKPIPLVLNKGRLKYLEKYQITDDEKRILFFTGSNNYYTLYIYNIEKSRFEDKRVGIVSIFTYLYKNSLYYYTVIPHERTRYINSHILGTPVAQDKHIYKLKKNMKSLPLYYVIEPFIIFFTRIKNSFVVTIENLKDKNSKKVIFKTNKYSDIRILLNEKNIYLYAINATYLGKYNISYKLNFQNGQYIGKNMIMKKSVFILEDLQISKHYFIALIYSNFKRKINVYDLAGKYIDTLKTFKWQDISLYVNQNSDNIHYIEQSFKDYIKCYRCNVKKKLIKLIYQYKASKNYESSNYRVKKVLVPDNGVNIPIFMLYHKKVKLKNENPLVLDIYGGYGIKIRFECMNERLIYLNNGGVYVFASLRGDGDLSDKWAYNGRGKNKKNTFIDLETVSKFLINEKYTNRDKFIIRGQSNGGLTALVGMLKNPELYKAVIAISPSIDIFDKYDIDVFFEKNFGSKEDVLEWYPFYNKLDNKKYPDVLLNVNLKDTNVLPYNGLSFAKRMKSKTNVLSIINNKKNYSHDYLKNHSLKDLRSMYSENHFFYSAIDIFLFIYDKLNLIKI